MFTDLKPGNASSLYVSAEEVPGHSLFEIMPLDLAQKVIERIDSVISTQQTHAIQYKLEQNGEMKDFEARISYLDENHVISIVRDISEQRNALKSIQTQNRFQKMVAEVSTEFVKSKASNLNTILDNSLQKVGEFFAVQRAYLYRYSDDYTQLINTNEWASADSNKLHSKKRIYSCSAIPWWHNMILSGKLIKIENLEELKPLAPIEYQILKQQDIYSILCIPIQSGTKVLGYFGFDSTLSPRSYTNAEIDNLQVVANLLAEVLQKQDIEQKMQKQMKLQALISKLAMKYINLPSAEMDQSIDQSLKEIAEFSDADRAYIFDYDWQGGVCIVRNDWKRSTDMENARQHKVLAIDDLLPWAELHKMGQTVVEEDVTNADLPDNLLQILKIQGIKSTVLSPLMHEDDCLGFVGLDFRRDFRNISDNDVNLLSLYAQLLVNVRNRKQLEDTLILEKERAEAASKAKSEFLANMSHEIRTPLNGVIGFAELLFNSGLENAQSQYANNIVNSSYNLLGIINDVLDLSKIEAGKLEISPVRTDLIELVEHATDIIKVKTEQKGLEILLDMDPDLPQFAILDPLRVNQILINLLSNAEKFTDSGEIELKVSHKMIDSEHAEISFSVRDTGIGIDPTLQKRLFRAFSQLDSSTTRKYGGTGLGLVISNHLANLMKSKIELQSRAGEGSVFSFKISSRVEGKRRCDLQKIGKKRALVVDDNSTGLNILGRCLRYWHCEFSPFKDAENALKHLKQDSDYDFLMIDYDMPGMSGIELIKKIYAQIPDLKSKIPIILMHNAVEDSTLQQECTKLGLRHRILKPIKAHTLHELLVSLNSATGKPQAPNPSKRINMPNPTLSFSRPPQILITEDNYLNMVLLKEMILQQIPEAKILQASDGIEAIQELKNNSPDIVLMDVQMPNMDGVTASTEIRKISDVPIVAITAGALKEEQSRCLSAGMNDFLTKPVLANELMHVLLKYLDKPQKSSDADASAPTDKAPEKSLERFNKSKLLKNLSGDEATVSSLVEMVIESFPQKFESLENAIAEDDKGQIKSLLHALKGTSQNMQFEILGQMIAGLEREFAGLEPQMIQSRYQNILKEWKQVLELIS
jgi:signal transduction histidine kinase/DNA-binding response OmpR family regulator